LNLFTRLYKQARSTNPKIRIFVYMKFLTEREFYLCRLKHIDMMRNYKTTKQDTGHEEKK